MNKTTLFTIAAAVVVIGGLMYYSFSDPWDTHSVQKDPDVKSGLWEEEPTGKEAAVPAVPMDLNQQPATEALDTFPGIIKTIDWTNFSLEKGASVKMSDRIGVGVARNVNGVKQIVQFYIVADDPDDPEKTKWIPIKRQSVANFYSYPTVTD